MKGLKFSGLICLVGIMALSVIGCSSDDGDSINQNYANITIRNYLSVSITEIYIVPSVDQPLHGWRNDKLTGGQTIAPNQSRSFPGGFLLSQVDKYDIRVVDQNGDTYTKLNVTASNDMQVNIYIADKDS